MLTNLKKYKNVDGITYNDSTDGIEVDFSKLHDTTVLTELLNLISSLNHMPTSSESEERFFTIGYPRPYILVKNPINGSTLKAGIYFKIPV